MNSEQKELKNFDQDYKNKESKLIKEILSSNVIMQHLTPWAWLKWFDIASAKSGLTRKNC